MDDQVSEQRGVMPELGEQRNVVDVDARNRNMTDAVAPKSGGTKVRVEIPDFALPISLWWPIKLFQIIFSLLNPTYMLQRNEQTDAIQRSPISPRVNGCTVRGNIVPKKRGLNARLWISSYWLQN